MKTSTGIWIDHRKAVIVTLSGEAQQTREIRSGVESQPSRKDGAPLGVHHEAQLVKADDSHQRQYTGHLNKYFASVVAAVYQTGALLILGPGEAKGELRKRLERANFPGRVLDLETVDKMTNREITARVRLQFDPVAPNLPRGR